MFALQWRRRRRAHRDDTGSMPIALLVTLLSVTLSAGISGVVVGQIKDTKRLELRVSAVAAAQAGLDSALSKIRLATMIDANGISVGDPNSLGCGTAITGALPGGGGQSQSFSTTIGYFVTDPSDAIETLKAVGPLTNLDGLTNNLTGLLGMVGRNLTTTLASGGTVEITKPLTDALGSAISCLGTAPKDIPLFGLLRSEGKVAGVTRTLYATYKFRTSEDTIPGGKIVINNGSGTRLCLGSKDNPPVLGGAVTAVDCNSDSKLVTFSYPKSLTLSLSKTRTTAKTGTSAFPYGLCIGAPATLANNNPVTFKRCGADTTALLADYTQQWSYEVNAQTYYAASLSGLNKVRSSFCLAMLTPGSINTPIVVKNNACGSANQVGRSFVPENSVGAGGASLTSGQYVNRDEFGRCLDLTNEAPTATSHGSHPVGLISYPCKQTLSGDVYWNHKWTGPLTQQLLQQNVTMAQGPVYTTQPGGKKWCMKSPGVDLGFVWVAECAASAANQQWIVFGASPNINEAYQVKDKSTGLCLEAGGARGSYYQFSGWSYIITAKCNGSDEQKWNAPTDWDSNPLKSIQEK